MKAERQTAFENLFCGRCQDLGIPDKTIFTNNTYYVISDEEKAINSCQDCWDRLMAEIERDYP